MHVPKLGYSLTGGGRRGYNEGIMKKKKRKIKSASWRKEYKEKASRFSLPLEIKQMILGVLLILIALVICLSFFNLAGTAGKYLITGLSFLIGSTVFIIPLILILGGLVFLNVYGY